MPTAYLDAVDADIRVGYHQFDHIFAIAEHAKTSLTEHYGVPADRISVVGTGRGIIKPFTGEKDYAKGGILFVAKERFEDKGGQLLLDAFRIARDQNPDLQLWLVGDPRLRETAGNDSRVQVFGFLPIEELQALFDRASLFAMPAPREPWGLVFLEALSCRTPILGLARGAIPEITQNGRFGFSVETASAEVIAQAILQAFSDPSRLVVMGKEGQHHVLERYTWEKVVDRILERIDQIPT